MEIYNNTKEFKVLKLTKEEALKIGMGVENHVICMRCNEDCSPVYYIAVLNDCMCEDCFKDWLEDATNYSKNKVIESRIESRNFNYYYKRAIALL